MASSSAQYLGCQGQRPSTNPVCPPRSVTAKVTDELAVARDRATAWPGKNGSSLLLMHRVGTVMRER
jgi:hypothetical protein